MFWLCIIGGILVSLGIGVTILIDAHGEVVRQNSKADGEKTIRSAALWIAAACVVIMLSAFSCGYRYTTQGQMYWARIAAGASGGDWLVIDNSGGKTMRHWLLEKKIVKSSSLSDGWEFIDSQGNVIYLGGDALLVRINSTVKEFRKTYKVRFNIPADQEVLR